MMHPPSPATRTNGWALSAAITTLALAAWANPTIATVDTPAAFVPTTLRPIAGQPTSVELNLPRAAGRDVTWENANVAQFFVRAAGKQDSLLPLRVAPGAKQATLNIEQPGPALLCIGVGPPDARGHSDSWQRTTHCAKLVLNVQPPSGESAESVMRNPGITAKTGQKIEILPLMDPTRLALGSDLGIRVYYEGVKITGARLTATIMQKGLGKDGEQVEAARPTDSEGTTYFRVAKAGIWTIRFVHEVEDENNPTAEPVRYTAELVFEVMEGGQPS